MRVVTLFMVLVLIIIGAPIHAGQFIAGECGGVEWVDDPGLEYRLYLVNEEDLPILAQAVQQIKINCTVTSLSIYQTESCRQSSRFECAVVVAHCPSALGITNEELWQYLDSVPRN